MKNKEIEIVYRFQGNADEIKKIINNDEHSAMFILSSIRNIKYNIQYQDTLYMNPAIKHNIILKYYLNEETYLTSKNKFNNLFFRVATDIHSNFSLKRIAECTKYKISSPKTTACLMGTIGGLTYGLSLNEYFNKLLKKFVPIQIELNTVFHSNILKKKTLYF